MSVTVWLKYCQSLETMVWLWHFVPDTPDEANIEDRSRIAKASLFNVLHDISWLLSFSWLFKKLSKMSNKLGAILLMVDSVRVNRTDLDSHNLKIICLIDIQLDFCSSSTRINWIWYYKPAQKYDWKKSLSYSWYEPVLSMTNGCRQLNSARSKIRQVNNSNSWARDQTFDNFPVKRGGDATLGLLKLICR